MSKISIVTPTYNERENIEQLCEDIKKEMNKINLDYEHIVIDNSSTDGTIDILKKFAQKIKMLRELLILKNYGHTKSPFTEYFKVRVMLVFSWLQIIKILLA